MISAARTGALASFNAVNEIELVESLPLVLANVTKCGSRFLFLCFLLPGFGEHRYFLLNRVYRFVSGY